jgi:hypothetical protein
MNLDIHIVKRQEQYKWHKRLFDSLVGVDADIFWLPFDKDLALTHQQGILAGTKPFVSYIDDDDYAGPRMFEHLVQALIDNPNAVASYSSAVGINARGVEVGLQFDAGARWDFWKAIHNIGYPHGIVVWRREVLEEVLPHSLAFGWYGNNILKGLSAAIGDFVGVPEAVVYKQSHAEQLTRTQFAGMQEAQRYIKDVALNCRACRIRLGLRPLEDITSTIERAQRPNQVVKCCGK